MRIASIETGNFKALSGERKYEDLPDGIIGVVGDNGRGKSTLMSAVAYALYGPEVLDTGNADVVTWGEKKGVAQVEVGLNGYQYTVKRWITSGSSDATVVRDISDEREKIASGATVVTNEVERLLGIDRVGFLASVFSKQEDLLGIGSLLPAKRASTVLRLLQFDRIDAGLKNLSETLRDLNKEVNVWRAATKPVLTVDPKVIAEHEEQRVLLTAKSDELATATDYLFQRMKKIEERVDGYNLYASKANSLAGELRTAQEALDKALAEANVPAPSEPTRPKVAIDVNQYLAMHHDWVRAKEAQAESICPTCKRPYDAQDAISIKANVERLGKWIEDNTAAYDATEAYQREYVAFQRAEERHKEAGERLKTASTLVRDKQDALDALVPVENPVPEWNAANIKFQEANSRHNKVKVQLAEVQSGLNHMKIALENQEEAAAHYAKIADDIKRIEHDILVNGQTELLMKQYKNALIASVIPAITERASALITEMTEGKYTELHLTPQYDIEYRNEQGDLKSFANLSGGEKDVFALALRLSIADLKAGSIGVLVLDEVLESLDPGRQEATWAALERLTSRYNQIFVITHVDTFKDRAPYSITV